jgi:hypothetical protein
LSTETWIALLSAKDGVAQRLIRDSGALETNEDPAVIIRLERFGATVLKNKGL